MDNPGINDPGINKPEFAYYAEIALGEADVALLSSVVPGLSIASDAAASSSAGDAGSGNQGTASDVNTRGPLSESYYGNTTGSVVDLRGQGGGLGNSDYPTSYLSYENPPPGPVEIAEVTIIGNPVTPSQNPQFVLTPDALQQLNSAIQQAVGPYDPDFFNTGPPEGIRDVLAGTDRTSFLDANVPPGSPPVQRVDPLPMTSPVEASTPQWTETGMAFSPPDHRLIQPVTHYDSGNPTWNYVANNALLPWVNVAAYLANIPLSIIVGVDDALRRSPFQMEYQAFSDMMPLEGAMGLSMEIGPAIDFARSWVSTNQTLRSMVTAPAFMFVGMGVGAMPRTTVRTLLDEGWTYHHWFPQSKALSERFADLGIDVHQYTTLLPAEFHFKDLHSTAEWNKVWEEWLDEAEDIGLTEPQAAQKAVDYLYKLLQAYLPQMEQAGISGPNGLKAIVPYPRQ